MRLLFWLLLSFPIIAMAGNTIVVSLVDQKLYVVDQDEVVATYPVVVGKRSTPTPTGDYIITSVVAKPTWTVPASIMKERHHPAARLVPPGPGNPLGAYFLRLNGSSIGIHGTTQPSKIPGALSHGCIRLRNEDVSELALLVEKGTSVKISVEPFVAPPIGAGSRTSDEGEAPIPVESRLNGG